MTTQLVQELIVALALSEKDKRIMIDYININNKCLSFFLLSTSIQMKICLYMDSETKNKTSFSEVQDSSLGRFRVC